MKAKMLNNVKLSGYLYDHNLTSKVSGPNSKNPGTEFISGTISVATDDNITNIVDVHFTYVTATNKNGANPLYSTLVNIINGVYKTVMSVGKDAATKLRVDTALGLNEFYSDRNGTEELISAKRNEGGFIHTVTALSDSIDERNLFDVDMVITNVRRQDADPDRGTSDKVILKGAIFDFRKSLLPIELSVVNTKAMDYFESLEVSSKNPVFTHLKGREVSETIVKKIVEEGAFGEDSVREVQNSRKDFVVHWAAREPYPFDDEDFVTKDELKQASADRETHVAELKARNDAYKASKTTVTTTKTVTAVASDDDFDF